MMLDPALSTALAGLLVALGLLVTAYTGILARRAASQAAQAAQAATGALRQAAATGAMKRNVTLPVLWNQLDDPLTDGTLPPSAPMECGEECVAMVINWAHGTEVSADALRWELRHAPGGAATTGEDLTALLLRNNVACVLTHPSAAEVKGALTSILGSQPALMRGRWVSLNVSHWVLVHTFSVNGVTFNDPWGGIKRNMAWSEVQKLYDGDIVAITQPRDRPRTVVSG